MLVAPANKRARGMGERSTKRKRKTCKKLEVESGSEKEDPRSCECKAGYPKKMPCANYPLPHTSSINSTLQRSMIAILFLGSKVKYPNYTWTHITFILNKTFMVYFQ